MSVAALSRREPGSPRRIVLALGTVALVGLVVALGLWLAGPASGPPRPHPFGMGLGESASSASGLARLMLSWQSAFFTALRGALGRLRAGEGGAALLLAIGFAYGVFHAAGPGHGKAIIAAYIVSSERALRRGIAVSFAAALIQAGVAIALVTVVFLAIGGTAATMAATARTVEIAGFGLVAALGAVLVWRKAGKLAAAMAGPRHVSADPCACAPPDPAASRGGSLRMAGVALGAGIRPCAGAIVVLTLSRAYGIFPAGIAATLAMALGTAATTGALAILSVYMKRAALRLAAGGGRFTALAGSGVELAAAALVLVIGLALLVGAWDGSGST